MEHLVIILLITKYYLDEPERVKASALYSLASIVSFIINYIYAITKLEKTTGAIPYALLSNAGWMFIILIVFMCHDVYRKKAKFALFLVFILAFIVNIIVAFFLGVTNTQHEEYLDTTISVVESTENEIPQSDIDITEDRSNSIPQSDSDITEDSGNKTPQPVTKTKEDGGYEITNLHFGSDASFPVGKGTIKNNTDKVWHNVIIGVRLLDEDGSYSNILDARIEEIRPGESADFTSKDDPLHGSVLEDTCKICEFVDLKYTVYE